MLGLVPVGLKDNQKYACYLILCASIVLISLRSQPIPLKATTDCSHSSAQSVSANTIIMLLWSVNVGSVNAAIKIVTADTPKLSHDNCWIARLGALMAP